MRLEQVFTNLLVNASKFTLNGGHVWLGAHTGIGAQRTSAHASQLTVIVRDDGVGIDSEMLPHIFDLFIQGEQPLDRRQGGLGIGLTLVKRLVELHGGVVTVASEGRGKGTEFTVQLPTVARPAAATSPTHVVSATANEHGIPRKLLIVDDNVDAAESLRMLLEMEGHQVEVAHEGEGALRKAETFKPHAALLDIGLPGMDGYELARRLRDAGDGNQPWLIALSGYGQDTHRRYAEDAGFDRYVVKPVDYDALKTLLDSLPQRRD